ncbi:MAG: hypothetical protein ABEJ72_06430 [Candidatus Aenigmatarchaeota archaeon]
MDILVIDPVFEDVYGGAREVSYTAAEVLSDAGHTVKLIQGSERPKERFEEFYGLDLSEVQYEKAREPVLHKIPRIMERGMLLKRSVEEGKFLRIAKREEDNHDLIFLGRHTFNKDLGISTPVLQYVHNNDAYGSYNRPWPYRRLYEHFAEPGMYENSIKILMTQAMLSILLLMGTFLPRRRRIRQ